MLFERIESEGLAHYSYLIGDQSEAVVIDPRRDCDVYIDRASRAGFRITTILETHRNEDYAIGSVELAARLGGEESDVQIWHADGELDYHYGHAVEDRQTWQIGRLSLQARHTPGHTPGHMSYLLHDPDSHPWIVFTGDALFAGDVGRADLLGEEHLPEMAAMLYDTLFETLLPLGDHVIVCPAHGSGSVCGSSIAERVWTTIGLERQHNPKLQYDSKEAFVAGIAEMLERPPYFRTVERLNLEGAPLLGNLPTARPLKPAAFAEIGNGLVLDTRMELAFGAAHVPDALSIWQGGLASFAGWFLPYDRPLFLVTPGEDPTPTIRTLIRLGYDDIAGSLAGGLLSWHMAGRDSQQITTLTTQQLCHRLDSGETAWILDVRSDEEREAEGAIADAHHIHITQLPHHLDDVPQDQPVYIFCGSGLRSMLAASLLQRSGWTDLTVILGGTKGWDSTACPLEP
ncbi:MAG: MBL fold metallo-hydrolase [Anaerolineae bacterium]